MGNCGLYGDCSCVITDPKQKEQVIIIDVDPAVRKNLKTPAVQGHWYQRRSSDFTYNPAKNGWLGRYNRELQNTFAWTYEPNASL